jgi:hypothetical protein
VETHYQRRKRVDPLHVQKQSARHRRRMVRDPEYAKAYKERARRLKFRRKYDISYEVYEQMVTDQGSRCLVCRRRAKLCVDHNHQSGVVRGLLCHNCNTGLGFFRDNPVLLRRASRYLMEEGEN